MTATLHKSFEVFLQEKGYETGNLPGSRSYKSTQLEKGKMMKMPPSVTLVHQPYRHIDHVEFMNVQDVQEFVKYWQFSLHQVEQRCGWMYGYYLDDPNVAGGYRAVVEGIYEPSQVCVDDEVKVLSNDERTQVDVIANELGLELIGFIFTSLARGSDHLMNSYELVRGANMQMANSTKDHYTKYALSKFITCIVHPDMQKEGSPQTDVFMVSDQLCGMMRDKLVVDEQADKKRLEIRPALPGEIQPQVLEAGRNATNNFDPDWFVVKINSGAPVVPKSFFIHAHFPRENRPNTFIARSEIKKYLSKCNSNEPNWMKLADFHLIIYIAKFFDIETAKVICQAVRDRTTVDPDLFELIRAAE